jgi:hypothetical protein
MMGITKARIGSEQAAWIRFARSWGGRGCSSFSVSRQTLVAAIRRISVHDVDDFVRCDRRQLVVVQSVDQPAREDENGVLLPDTAGECVERGTVDDADIRRRQACRDCQRLDDAAEPRLVVIVDEAEIRPAANGADVPRHLNREQDGADDGDDRHPTDEVSRPLVERRMVGIVHGERYNEPQCGEQVKRRDEARE